MKKITILAALIIPAIFLFTGCQSAPTDNTNQLPTEQNQTPAENNVKTPPETLTITNVQPNQKIESPLTITGTAKGWYFEAVFPIKLLDESGKVLATTQAQAQGDWMTTDAVPFKAVMTFDAKDAKKGTLVFSRDNPSGLPENDESYEMPVSF